MIKKIFDWPPIWMGMCIVLAHFLAILLPFVTIGEYFPSWIWIAPLVVGFVYIILAEVYFLRSKTTVIPRRTPTVLLTSGPFKISRNPIYTGYALILLAAIIKIGSLASIVALPVFVWVIQRRFIAGEERQLREKFGEEARKWIENTAKW